MFIQYSKVLENAVNEISKLPGIGKRSALRLVLHLTKTDIKEVFLLSETIQKLKTDLKVCEVCYNLSDHDRCSICQNEKRDHSLVCVVQDIRDIIAIENTNLFKGVYHVLGGVISPMEGIGTKQIRLDELFKRVSGNKISEVVLALPATPEGDTTNFYIYKNIKDIVPKVTTLARGVGINEELEYADEVTLGRSIIARTEFAVVM